MSRAHPSAATFPPASRALPLDIQIGGYCINQVVGEGGMGRVYSAVHMATGQLVALKELRQEHARDLSQVRRFFAEARTMSLLRHENVVAIIDTIDAGVKAYVMELLIGCDLSALLREIKVIPVARTLTIAAQICRALRCVHAAGVVHRDLKPQNIFLVDRGGQDFVKLVDYGIAKQTTPPSASDLSTTASGLILGTPDYMAPEQFDGFAVDSRTDTYALGVILYEMLTGVRPFSAKTFSELVFRHHNERPKRPSRAARAQRLPRRLDDLVMACLEKRPEDRPQTMEEIERRLADIATHQSAPTFDRPPRTHSALAVLAAALLLAVGVGCCWRNFLVTTFSPSMTLPSGSLPQRITHEPLPSAP